ncbi:hypothetical protein [Streptomyces tropicalis]|uniref:Integral membrane protein n=1 Tax=Streptomyces tropicalis TaxID=3034234 RepID=A0ABT6AAU8_9ACTN|nr:hypothetical protein [Streptomyces tropicalis]MDF3301782.1 hypothetical protein [Streptomyces tropicalis]
MADTTQAARTTPARDTRSMVVFGGVYGAVVASAMVAALTEYGHSTRGDRRYDAAWLLVTAFASALAHGYAHYIAERGPRRRGQALRALAAEWPLVVAMLPTALILAGAGWGWWPADRVELPAFVFNIGLLFVLGLLSARWAGRRWPAALVTGVGDALLGLFVVVANALIK